MTDRQSTDYVAMGKDMGLEGKELAKFVKEQFEAEKLIQEQKRKEQLEDARHQEQLEIDERRHQEQSEERQREAEERQRGAEAQRQHELEMARLRLEHGETDSSRERLTSSSSGSSDRRIP